MTYIFCINVNADAARNENQFYDKMILCIIPTSQKIVRAKHTWNPVFYLFFKLATLLGSRM